MNRVTIRTDGFDGFRKLSLARAQKLDRGELLQPEKILTLDESAFKTLTRARIGVYRKVKEKEISITALADSLDRPREAVSRDVTMLQSAGLVKLRKATNPGHGHVVMVSPVAEKVFVEL